MCPLNKNNASTDQTIQINWAPVAYTSYYWLHIYRNGQDYINKSLGLDLSFFSTFPVGEYTAYVTACNSLGESSSRVDFTIYDKAPDKPCPQIDKTVYTTNETVTISWNAVENTELYWLHIYKNGNDYENKSLNLDLRYSAKYPVGNYTAFIVSVNSVGETLSYVNFSVYDTVPDAPVPKIERSSFSTNDTVDITWDKVDNAASYWLHIYRNGEDYENKSLDSALRYSDKYPVGKYTAYIVSINGMGETLSYVNFSVYDSAPDAPELKLSGTLFTTDETIEISWGEVKNAENYWLHIYRNGEDYASKDLSSALSYSEKYPAGDYTAFIVAYNGAGETQSKIEFKVYVKGDLNNDNKTTVADLILLQKWLLGTSAELICPENADLCKDGIIDVYDLALLRRLLLSK